MSFCETGQEGRRSREFATPLSTTGETSLIGSVSPGGNGSPLCAAGLAVRQRVRPRHRHPLRQSGRAVLGQFESGSRRSRGGPSPACGHRRSRAGFEILVSGEDFDGERAERYGYVEPRGFRC